MNLVSSKDSCVLYRILRNTKICMYSNGRHIYICTLYKNYFEIRCQTTSVWVVCFLASLIGICNHHITCFFFFYLPSVLPFSCLFIVPNNPSGLGATSHYNNTTFSSALPKMEITVSSCVDTLMFIMVL